MLARARAAGVELIVDAGDEVEASRRALEAAGLGVWVTCGIHPNQASRAAPGAIDELERLLGHPRAVGVGEAGLDYYRHFSSRDDQWRLFRAQLRLAAERNLPAVVHSREAADDTLRLLREAPGVRGVMHCFSYDWQVADACLKMGFFLSLAGPLTYPRSRALAEVARRAPIDRLLIETDAPYLPPQGRRGQRNEPAFVAHTCSRLAELRDEDPEKVAETTLANTRALFGIAAREAALGG